MYITLALICHDVPNPTPRRSFCEVVFIFPYYPVNQNNSIGSFLTKISLRLFSYVNKKICNTCELNYYNSHVKTNMNLTENKLFIMFFFKNTRRKHNVSSVLSFSIVRVFVQIKLAGEKTYFYSTLDGILLERCSIFLDIFVEVH